MHILLQIRSDCAIFILHIHLNDHKFVQKFWQAIDTLVDAFVSHARCKIERVFLSNPTFDFFILAISFNVGQREIATILEVNHPKLINFYEYD